MIIYCTADKTGLFCARIFLLRLTCNVLVGVKIYPSFEMMLTFDLLNINFYNLQDECNGYGFEVDSWACGVIMYTLLIGRPPFWHRKQMMLIRQIMRGEYTMTGPDWAEVTSETRDLVRFEPSLIPTQQIDH